MASISLCSLFLALLCVVQQASCLDCGNNKSHNAFFGSRRVNDQLLYTEHPKLSSHFLRKGSTDVVFPKNGENRINITYIELLDQYTNGKGGCGYIADGGVGSNVVKIHLKTQRGEGLDFIVNIFGLKSWW